MTYSDLFTPNLRLAFFNKSIESHYANIYASYNDPVVISKRGKVVNTYADIDYRSRFSIPLALCHKSPPPEYTFVLCFLRETDEYVGYISAHFKGEDQADPENTQMGWAVLERFWRKGYASEAACAVLRWCDEVLGLERIGAQVREENVASCRVAEKAGGKVKESRIDFAGDAEGEKMVEYEWIFKPAN